MPDLTHYPDEFMCCAVCPRRIGGDGEGEAVPFPCPPGKVEIDESYDHLADKLKYLDHLLVRAARALPDEDYGALVEQIKGPWQDEIKELEAHRYWPGRAALRNGGRW